jgi:hypothetical protein
MLEAMCQRSLAWQATFAILDIAGFATTEWLLKMATPKFKPFPEATSDEILSPTGCRD